MTLLGDRPVNDDNDLFPMSDDPGSGQGFHTVFRGYDKDEVDRYCDDLERDIHALQERHREDAARIAALEETVERLRAEVAELEVQASGKPLTSAQIGERAARLLATAEEEAADMVASARREAETITAEARREAAQATSEREKELARLETELRGHRQEAEREAAAVVSAAQQQAQSVVSDAERAAQHTREEARKEATATVTEARRQLAQLTARRDTLAGDLERAHQQLGKLIAPLRAEPEPATEIALETPPAAGSVRVPPAEG